MKMAPYVRNMSYGHVADNRIGRVDKQMVINQRTTQ